jgi:hypothetical protein
MLAFLIGENGRVTRNLETTQSLNHPTLSTQHLQTITHRIQVSLHICTYTCLKQALTHIVNIEIRWNLIM